MNFADFFALTATASIVLAYSCVKFKLEPKKIRVKKTK